MNALLVAAILIPTSVHPQVLTRVSNLDEALQAYEDQVPVEVPYSIGIYAALALKKADMLPSEQIERLLRISADGRAHSHLAPIVGALVAGGVHVEPALRIAGRLPDAERAAVVRALGKADSVRFGLLDACLNAEDDDVAGGALWITVPSTTPDDLLSLLRSLSELEGDLRRARRALALAAQTDTPRQTFEALLDGAPYLPETLTASIGDALAALVERSPEAAQVAIERGSFTPSPLILRALGGVPAESWEGARDILVTVLAGYGEEFKNLPALEADQLAAAVLTAGQLRVPELLDLIPGLMEPGVNLEVRVAALLALGFVGDRDVATMDRLIQHLEPPGPLADAAYKSLLLKSGVSMPHRAVMWREWRKRQEELWVTTPEQNAERLAAERDAAYRARSR
jgi:hypothetical protein